MYFIRACIVAFCILSTPKIHAALGDDGIDASREKLLTILSGDWVARSVYVAAKLEIADHLLAGPMRLEELGQAVGADPESLRRLIHLLQSHGIFEVLEGGEVQNTFASATLAKSHPDSLYHITLFYGEEVHSAWKELFLAVKSGKTAFYIKYQEPVFSYFKNHKERALLFQAAMREKTKGVAASALEAFDFGAYRKVIDIGGGEGQFIEAVMRAYPEVHGTLFELPEVIQRVKESKTLTFPLIEGDFFSSVPKGADLYILKSILHDWDDRRCIEILNHCSDAISDDARLLVIENVLLPKDGSLYANAMDLLMLTMTGGKERSLESFKEMFDQCNFEIVQIYPTSTEFSLLELKKKTRI